jgi:hypothetical protein
LNTQILQAKTPNDVLKLVQEEKAFNAVNIATAYHRLATFVREERGDAQGLRRDHRLLKLETLLLERIPSFGAQVG